MQLNRYSEEQVVGVFKAWNAGGKINDLVRDRGVSEPTLSAWCSKFAGI